MVRPVPVDARAAECEEVKKSRVRMTDKLNSCREMYSHQDINNSRASSNGNTLTKEPIPLRAWVDLEAVQTTFLQIDRSSLIRKLTVAYAIGELLKHLKDSVLSYSQDEILRLCCVDNFSVTVHADGVTDEAGVMGIDMVSPPMSLKVIPKYVGCSINDTFANAGARGRDIETVITRHSPFCCAKISAQDKTRNDGSICYALGVLLHFIFSGGNTTDNSNASLQENSQHSTLMNDLLRSLSVGAEETHSTKRAFVSSQCIEESSTNATGYGQIGRLLRDLLSCESLELTSRSETAYASLDAVIDDMHLLLLDPSRYVFDVNHQLSKDTKMYGRSSEATTLLNAYYRVIASGKSEALLVKGFSGSGKTRLVRSTFSFSSVLDAKGLWVEKKFEENSTNQLSLILSAFNDLCVSLAENFEEVNIWQELLSEFGHHFQMLIRTLPNVIQLAPSPSSAKSSAQNVDNYGGINFFSLCDIINRFLNTVYTATSRTVVIFLDDLQWADSVSLGLIHAILSEQSVPQRRASCVFFVGSYRDNEVPDGHILHGFNEMLTKFHVSLNSIGLDSGLNESDVNLLVSESLCMLPRLCRTLSEIVSRKTEGNPFFVQTFIRSLVDKGLLTYSLSERCWIWDVSGICHENFTPNVIDLLLDKMARLSQDGQNSLILASCFGMRVDASIVQELSCFSRYSTLLHDLNKAVEVGLMDLITDRAGKNIFTFVHDKVWEAAYASMISTDNLEQTHFDLGMALLSRFESQVFGDEEKGDILLVILDLINHGVPSLLQGESEQASIAKLNHDMASQMLQSYKYTSAYKLSKMAVSLLPDDSWSSQYHLSLEYYFSLSKAAYSCGNADEAKHALNKVVQHATSLRTKLDAYVIFSNILFNACEPKEMGQLLITIVGVLGSLGEVVQCDNVSQKYINNQVLIATANFERECNDEMLHNYRSEDQNAVMQAYRILVNLAYIAKPKFYPYYVSQWTQYCLNHKVATPAVYVTFAVVLFQDISDESILLGRQIGKLGIDFCTNLFNQNHSFTSELCDIHLLYYSHVGPWIEPIQDCIGMHRRGYDIALQMGHISTAALQKQFLIARQFYAGTNLLDLKEELEHEIKMSERYCALPMLGMKLHVHYDTVLTLIGEESSHPSNKQERESIYDQEQAYMFSRIMSLSYLGYYERVLHMAKQWTQLSGDNETKLIGLRAVYVSFYNGMSSIGLLRRKKVKTKRIPSSTLSCLDIVQHAAKLSKWNFQNKASLLLAEKLSFSQKNCDAEVQYVNAVEEAKSSSFVHEEGLASELAGAHYERLGNIVKALPLFQQAENCYVDWGSMVKTRQMQEKIRSLQDILGREFSSNR